MIKFLFIFFLLFIQSCSKQKAVLICGDHICINKNEANQYFEENLSIEVKITDKRNEKKFDLVQLNLKDNDKKKEINITKKNKTGKIVKTLSNQEVKRIKEEIKKKNKNKRISLKKSKIEKGKLKVSSIERKDKNLNKKIVHNSKQPFDVCTILEECSIDEISKYLIKLGKKRNFPDISIRE